MTSSQGPPDAGGEERLEGRTSDPRIREAVRAAQKVLNDRIAKLDPSLVVELRAGPEARAGDFSDWHDRFNDNGRWADAWGKAGDLSRHELNP
jgi:hypothetical protein